MKKAAVYCRVSTEKTDQINSLQSQKKFFTDYISKSDNIELYKIYCDEGKTGTTVSGRKEFMKMINEGLKGEYDIILTKEISRFARNTLDSIKYTRILKSKGIGIYFINDGIYTLENDSELRLAILSSIAQEESRKTSERVRFGQKISMEKGVVFGRSLLGYDVKNGEMHINEEGAKIVRLIFSMAKQGMGSYKISKKLMEMEIPSFSGNNIWHNSMIHKILRNEKYTGDLVQQKTYTTDYLNHNRKYNKGEREFIIVRNHHEPIIDRETFLKVQKMLDKRKKSSPNRY